MADAVGGERIGSALRGLAEDLVDARRRLLLLRRENRELRAQLGALGFDVEKRFGSMSETEASRASDAAGVCPYCQRPYANNGGRPV